MRILKRLIQAVILLIFISIAAAGGGFYYFTRDLPSVAVLREYNPSLSTRVYSSDGALSGEFFIERRVVVPLSRMPDHLIQAFLSAEDAKFFEHEGLDFSSIFRAMYKNLKAGKITQGASTITQQVAKNFFLSSEKKYSRKIREAVMAYQIEKSFSKDEILHLYLNQIYFGNGAYGVQAASETYYGKDVNELTIAESALLAGLPKAPSRYSPNRNYAGAKKRQEFVLSRMVEERYLTKTEAARSAADPILLTDKITQENIVGAYFLEHVRRYIEEKYGQDRLYKGGLRVYTTMDVNLQKIATGAVRKGLEDHDRRRGYRGPMAALENPFEIETFLKETDNKVREGALKLGPVYTGIVTYVDNEKKSLNLSVGRFVGTVTKKELKWAGRYNMSGNPEAQSAKVDPLKLFKVGDIIQVRVKRLPKEINESIKFSLYQEPKAEAALLVMDTSTGHITAMVGGYDFTKSEYNRAFQSRRQPGSAFKPIIYASALDKGYTPASIVVDSPIIFEEEVQKKIEEIAAGDEAGLVMTPEIEETEEEIEDEEPLMHVWRPRNYSQKFYGPTTIRHALTKSRNVITIKVLRDIGVSSAIKYARKLGIQSPLARDLSLALGSSAVTLLEMSTTFATFDNLGRRPEPLFVTRVTDNKGRILEDNAPTSTQVISPATAYIMTSLLQGVVQNGTGWRAKSIKRPSAGKTGTTNNLNDAWYVGFIPGMVAGAWIGYDGERPLGKHETGSKAAAPIWVKFMKDAMKDKPVKNFTMPDGVEFAKIDPKTGLLATPGTAEPLFEVFKVGTKPTKYSAEKATSVQEPDFLMMDAGEEIPERESTVPSSPLSPTTPTSPL